MSKYDSGKVVKDIRHQTHRKYSAEECQAPRVCTRC